MKIGRYILIIVHCLVYAYLIFNFLFSLPVFMVMYHKDSIWFMLFDKLDVDLCTWQLKGYEFIKSVMVMCTSS